MAAGSVRDSYFETGLEILAELGFGALKLAELCRRMGVTTGSFYPLLHQLVGLHR